MGQKREIGQAKNINKILEKDPDAKIVLHVGSGHIREDSSEYGLLMAAHLKRMSGIDPLTINQCKLNEQSSARFEHELYNKLIVMDTVVYYVFLKNGKPINDGLTDICVFPPRTEYIEGRPSWLYYNKRYNHIRVKNKLISTGGEGFLVFAYLKDELSKVNDALPVDIVWVENPEIEEILLLLPFNGTYTIVFESSRKTEFSEIIVP